MLVRLGTQVFLIRPGGSEARPVVLLQAAVLGL